MLKAGRDDEDYRHQNFYNSELKRAFEESTISEIGDMLLDEPSVASLQLYRRRREYAGAGRLCRMLSVFAAVCRSFRGPKAHFLCATSFEKKAAERFT
jgi:hypothetical protein